MIKPFDMNELLDTMARLLSTEGADFNDVAAASSLAWITTGNENIDKLLQGDILPSSVTLAEGPQGSCKSVLCQYVASLARAQARD